MVPGWLPANWRDGRLIYTLQINEPTRWIDPAAAESIASLNRHLGDILEEKFNIANITLSTLTGDDREPTTLKAEWLPEQVLDDGNYAARGPGPFKIRWRRVLGVLAAAPRRQAGRGPSGCSRQIGNPPQPRRPWLRPGHVRAGLPLRHT
jgi:hypothetical protein